MKIENNIKKLAYMSYFQNMHFISAVLVPFFTEWGGVSLTEVFILQSVFMGGIFILEIPTGTIADYFGRKISVIIGIMATMTAPLVYSSRANFYIFALSELIWALGNALQSGALEALLYDSLVESGQKEKSQEIVGKNGSYGVAGILTGALLGSLIGKYIGLRECMLFTAFPSTIGLFIAITLVEPSLHANEEKKANPIEIFKQGVSNLKKNKGLQKIAWNSILIGTCSYFSIWLYQAKLTQIDVDIQYFGIVNAAFLLIEMAMLRYYPQIEKGLKRKDIGLIITALLIGIGYIMLGASQSLVFVVISILITTGIAFSRPTFMLNYMNHHIDAKQRATVISTISMMSTCIKMLINPLVGYLADQYLDFTLIGIGITILILAVICRINPEDLH